MAEELKACRETFKDYHKKVFGWEITRSEHFRDARVEMLWETWKASWNIRHADTQLAEARAENERLNKKIEHNAIYEDVYEQCQELISPHIIERPPGSAISSTSLCASVVDSLDYLVRFWLKHKALATTQAADDGEGK